MFGRSKRAKVLKEISAERDRHIGLGYTATHDDQHSVVSLVEFAGAYANRKQPSILERRPDLVKAASILVAAIESIDRKVEAP